MSKKTVFIAILVPFSLAIFVIGILFSVLNWPTLILNESTLKYSKKYLIPFGINISWEKFYIEAKSHGFLDKTVTLR